MTAQDTSRTHFSDFGGLWTDRLDAAEEIERRLADGRLNELDATTLRSWIAHGYVVLKGAVPPEICDRFRDDISGAFEHGDERLLMSSPETDGKYEPLRAGTSTVRARVVDSYAYYESAREALFSDAIVRFLKLVFERDPLLFQSLSFDRGSQQGMHQDSAYVVVSSPLEFAASWIALEDISEGSGELMYYAGSHRLPEFRFSGEHKHWNPERDGDEQHEEWARLLNVNAEKMGLERKVFLPRKGDVLIWAADLAHGGSPATNPELTRRSLVGHYCPEDISPNYYLYRDDRGAKLPARGGWYSSEHYDLSAQASPEVPEPAPAEPETERGGLLKRLFGR